MRLSGLFAMMIMPSKSTTGRFFMKRRFSSAQLFELRNCIPINVVIKDLLMIDSKTVDGYFRFLCPICNEFQTATKASTNLARCFSCKKNFNTIDLVMIVKNMEFVDSVVFLKKVLDRRKIINSQVSR
jgi:DNA primase